MPYSERVYFTGDHCAHCADRDESERLARIAKSNRATLRELGRRRGSRAL